jgi:hypothetical protein
VYVLSFTNWNHFASHLDFSLLSVTVPETEFLHDLVEVGDVTVTLSGIEGPEVPAGRTIFPSL